MKDKYRSTIDKVKFDEQAKAKMKTNLLTRNVKKIIVSNMQQYLQHSFSLHYF